jgi:hypothetical protein
MSEKKIHIVKKNECIASIAEQYGLHWQTIWNYPDNAELKKKRKDPNVLMEGDQVVVPEKKPREETASTDSLHRFVCKGVPSRFRMRLLATGKPRAGLKFSCTIDGQSISGKTDSNGYIDIPIPPAAQTGKLKVFDEGTVTVYELNFGELNPVNEVSGIQQRLRNLGYGCEITGEMDEATQQALQEFKNDRKLPNGSQIDDATRNALLGTHGG